MSRKMSTTSPFGQERNAKDAILSSNYFVVRTDLTGEVLSTDVTRVSTLSEEDAAALASAIWQAADTDGTSGRYKYSGVCDELLLLLHVFCKRADGALREQDHEQQHEDPAEYAERGGEQKDTQGGEEILRGVQKDEHDLFFFFVCTHGIFVPSACAVGVGSLQDGGGERSRVLLA